MARYNLLFKKSITRDIRAIPNKDVRRILNRIETLAVNPRPNGCEKLTDQERYRVRQGSYRIIYEVQDDACVVVVVKVSHRGGVYRH